MASLDPSGQITSEQEPVLVRDISKMYIFSHAEQAGLPALAGALFWQLCVYMSDAARQRSAQSLSSQRSPCLKSSLHILPRMNVHSLTEWTLSAWEMLCKLYLEGQADLESRSLKGIIGVTNVAYRGCKCTYYISPPDPPNI